MRGRPPRRAHRGKSVPTGVPNRASLPQAWSSALKAGDPRRGGALGTVPTTEARRPGWPPAASLEERQRRLRAGGKVMRAKLRRRR